MAYISGRTVKTSRKVAKTPVAAATATARTAFVGAVGHLPGVTVNSVQTAWGRDLTPAVRTTITFPAGTDTTHLKGALHSLPGVVAYATTPESATITRTV